MKTTIHVRLETESLDDITSLLEGRVFHVTKLSNLDSILTDGEIKPNGDSTLTPTFGNSATAFFRKRNCVCLFDYRPEPTDKIRDFRGRCSPFMPARPDSDGIAILLLKPDVHVALIPWTRWKEEGPSSERIAPYVEAGHRGPISINLLDEVICLELEEVPDSHAAILRKALQKTHRNRS